MTRTVVVMGVSGSGKTTVGRALAVALSCPFAEGDEHHSAANVAKMAAGTPLTDEDRRPWLLELSDWIGEQEQASQDAVLACSALKRAYRDVLRAGHPSVLFVHVTVDAQTLRGRLAHRTGHFLPASLLDSQLELLEPLCDDEQGVVVSGAEPSEKVVASVLAALLS